jgi:hypothetical protein
VQLLGHSAPVDHLGIVLECTEKQKRFPRSSSPSRLPLACTDGPSQHITRGGVSGGTPPGAWRSFLLALNMTEQSAFSSTFSRFRALQTHEPSPQKSDLARIPALDSRPAFRAYCIAPLSRPRPLQSLKTFSVNLFPPPPPSIQSRSTRTLPCYSTWHVGSYGLLPATFSTEAVDDSH